MVDARARVATAEAKTVLAPQVYATASTVFSQLFSIKHNVDEATPPVGVPEPHLRPIVHPVPTASPVKLHGSPYPTLVAAITRVLTTGTTTTTGSSAATVAAQVPAASVKQHPNSEPAYLTNVFESSAHVWH